MENLIILGAGGYGRTAAETARGNAKIYAEIVGYGNTDDAYHITAPHPEGKGASNAIRLALEEAGFHKETDSLYLNAHGTSTELNDKGETMAIKKALGDKAYDIYISSTKSMTGHMPVSYTHLDVYKRQVQSYGRMVDLLLADQRQKSSK